MKHKKKFIFLSSLLGWILALVIFEVGSSFYLKQFFYVSHLPLAYTTLSPVPDSAHSRPSAIDMAHPFLGRSPKGKDSGQNALDELLTRKYSAEKEFIIGIFGDGVAAQLANELVNDENFLQKITHLKSVGRKKIVILNLASVLSKQPEIFLTFSHFSNIINMAISISGENELANDNYPQFPLEYPLESEVLFNQELFSPQYLPRFFLIQKLHECLSFFPQKINIIRHSRGYFLLWSSAQAWLNRQSLALEKKMAEQKRPAPFFESHPLNPQQLGHIKFYFWSDYTHLMATLGQKLGIKTLFFYRPGKYQAPADLQQKFFAHNKWPILEVKNRPSFSWFKEQVLAALR